MGNPSFAEVKEAVEKWIKDSEVGLTAENVTIDIVKSNQKGLFAVLSNGEHMASIVVREPEFAPYRFVAFEMIIIENGAYKMAHAWYDEENTSIEEIIRNLDASLKLVLEAPSS